VRNWWKKCALPEESEAEEMGVVPTVQVELTVPVSVPLTEERRLR